MVYKYFFIFLLLPLTLYAYVDNDMDGVEDAYDRCLYTPFSDLVNSHGCTIESLVSPHSFAIITGLSYSDTDYKTLSKTNTLTSSIEFDYYYRDFSLSLSSSYFSNDSKTYSTSGMNDTYLGLEYTLLNEDLYISIAAGLVLPTYETPLNNNNIDYTSNININYNINNINFFALYGYSIINDDDIAGRVAYQNTFHLSSGVGYFFNFKLYGSILYSESDSIYKDVEKIRSASFYIFYSINEKYFTSMSYAYGLSDTASDNYLSVKLGYKF